MLKSNKFFAFSCNFDIILAVQEQEQKSKNCNPVTIIHSAVAQLVERSAVNRLVVGSSPTRGAKLYVQRFA